MPDSGHIAEGHADGHVKAHPAHHAFSVPGIAFFLVLILGSFGFVVYQAQHLIATNQLAAVITATLVDLANGDRRAENLVTLTVNPLLVAAAQAKANDMAEKSYFAHRSPDGRDSWSWFRDAGYTFIYAGENLAVNFTDSEDVEEAWMDSPTHRANILNGKFTEIGIATAQGTYEGKETIFVVQMFGTPSHPGAVPSTPVAVVVPEEPGEIAIATTEPEPLLETLPAPEENEAAAIVLEEAPATESSETVAVVDGAVEAESATGLSAPAPRYAGVLDFFASSPQALLRTIYIISALLIIGALAFVTEFEFKRHHTRHVAVALVLLALMGGLFVAADRVVFVPPTVGGATTAAP